MQQVQIIGKRFFREAGHTVHSVSIYIDCKHVATLRDNGGGSCYLETATDWLEQNGHIVRKKGPSGNREPLWRIAESKGFKVLDLVFDVTRKADL